MDVDAANVTQFKKLTLQECAQLTKEGRCFRCHLQGHMVHNCPKNINNNNTTVHTNEVTMPTKENTSPTPQQNTMPPAAAKPSTKLNCAQQIRAIEEAMTDEERSKYLDARDMGQDFWSARA
jgi:hypothetical protein